jgi:HK97 family phage major capsid protein
MAIPVDVFRGTSGVPLPPVVSQTVWQVTQEQSAVMRAAQPIPLPGVGVQVPIITGDPVASWVGETNVKPLSRPSFANKTIQASTLVVLVPFSNQFRRDATGLYQQIVQRLPLALAKKFDETVFGPQSGAPSSNFDTLGAATAVGIAGKTFNGLTGAETAIATWGPQDGELNGFVLSPTGRGVVRSAVDGFGRPLFDGPSNELLDVPVYRSRASYLADADGAGPGTDKQLGYAGDWSKAFWGSVEGIQAAYSSEATLTDTDGTQINLFQQNMFALRVEIEVGFRVRDLGYFSKLTSAVQA